MTCFYPKHTNNIIIEKESIFYILTDKENTLSLFHSTGMSFCLYRTPMPDFYTSDRSV